MNEDDPKSREHSVQNITSIPEISSTDHSHPQTVDLRIISKKSSFLRYKIPAMKDWALFRLISCLFTLISFKPVGNGVGI